MDGWERPGARFDEVAWRLTFRPDFLQGGGAISTVRFTASDGEAETIRELMADAEAHPDVIGAE